MSAFWSTLSRKVRLLATFAETSKPDRDSLPALLSISVDESRSKLKLSKVSLVVEWSGLSWNLERSVNTHREVSASWSLFFWTKVSSFFEIQLEMPSKEKTVHRSLRHSCLSLFSWSSVKQKSEEKTRWTKKVLVILWRWCSWGKCGSSNRIRNWITFWLSPDLTFGSIRLFLLFSLFDMSHFDPRLEAMENDFLSDWDVLVRLDLLHYALDSVWP